MLSTRAAAATRWTSAAAASHRLGACCPRPTRLGKPGARAPGVLPAGRAASSGSPDATLTPDKQVNQVTKTPKEAAERPDAPRGGDFALQLAIETQRDTQRLGRALGKVLSAGDLVVFEGELGAGKTYLVQSIVRALGVSNDQPVTSPTFEILHEFHGRVPIVHADLYRLDPSESLEELGLVPRIGVDAVVLVEWGERFASELGDLGLRVTLALGAGSKRRCTVCARGAGGDALFERLVSELSTVGLTPS